MLTLCLPPAFGGQARAKALFKEGATDYNIGNFDAAIAVWEAAYREEPDAELLYNIGQAHRLAGHLQKAIFFYRSYLREAPRARNRAEVQEKIAGLEAQVQAAPVARAPEPPLVLAPSPPPVAPTVSVARVAERSSSRVPPPGPVDLGAALGVDAWLSGAADDTKPSLAFNLSGAYRFGSPARRTSFRLGAKLGAASLSDRGATARIWSALLAPGVVSAFGDSVSLAGEVGLGLGVMSGLRPGSPLLPAKVAMVEGTLARFEARPAVTLAYRLGEGSAWLFVSSALVWNAARTGVFPNPVLRLELMAGACVAIGGEG